MSTENGGVSYLPSFTGMGVLVSGCLTGGCFPQTQALLSPSHAPDSEFPPSVHRLSCWWVFLLNINRS